MNPAFSFSLRGRPTQKSAKMEGEAIGRRDLLVHRGVEWGKGTRLIWSSLATSARSLSSFSSTDTSAAAAAAIVVGVREASKGKDGRRCQTSGGSASEEVWRGSRSAGFLYSGRGFPSGAVTECAAGIPDATRVVTASATWRDGKAPAVRTSGVSSCRRSAWRGRGPRA